MAEVKITMLGTSGAGKTCYILGLYATMQFGIQGFTLSATDMDEDLRLTSAWENMVEEEGENRWPPPTGMEPHQYEFDFSYGFRRLIGFDWLDYRGGAMLDSSKATDVQALMSRLQQSTCIFLCVSGEYLTEEGLSDTKLQSKAKRAGVHRMTLFLNNLAQSLKDNQKPFPIVIVITKYDLCQKRGRAVIEDLKRIFSSLFMPNHDWLVMICPVSLGKELGENSDTGKIDPKFLHLPLVFALYAKFRESMMTEQERVNQNKIKLEALRQGKWFQRLFSGDELRGTESSLDKAQNQLQDIQTKMALLGQELTNAQIYLGGKEIQVDV
jgi:GTPase SAR1 family protein